MGSNPNSIIIIMHAYLYCCFRVKFVAARDGLLPSFLSGVHNAYRTPLPAIVVSVSIKHFAYYVTWQKTRLVYVRMCTTSEMHLIT